MGFIYLLRTREFIRLAENIYKIGKTKSSDGLKRIKSYPSGSELVMLLHCEECDKAEKDLIEVFSKKYVRRLDIGNEYFEGNPIDMVLTIMFFLKLFPSPKVNAKNISNLKLPHMPKSNKSNGYICQFCGNVFTRHNTLLRHQQNTRYCLSLQDKSID